jgi:hypothetical protein
MRTVPGLWKGATLNHEVSFCHQIGKEQKKRWTLPAIGREVGGWKPCVPWAGGDFLESSIVFLSEFM